jgi:5-methylcytosine-specific restriction endonuclease McrA
MTREEYALYLESSRWAILRDEARERFDNRCAICYSEEEIEVHHRTYDRLGDEWVSDLVPLCADCHQKFHGALAAYTGPDPNFPRRTL